MALRATLLVIFVACAAAKDLPSYFPRCHIDDPKINDCLLKATNTVRPFLIKGVPELKIPPMEPFLLPEATLQQGTQALNFKATLYNTTVYGLSNYKFSKYEFDVKTLEVKCRARITPLFLKGLYIITGKILAAPIEGRGLFTANVTNVDFVIHQKTALTQRKGVDYLKLLETKTDIEIEEAYTQLDGLFGGGNNALARATNRVINQNALEFFKELKPVVEQIVTRITEDLLLSAVTTIPFSNLYPKSH